MNGCMKCGKELQIGDRVVWRCEDCARKQMEEYDNKCQRIAELEEQLANSIRPKFKIGQEVFVNDWTGQLRSGEICEIQTNQVRLMPLITYLVDFYGSYCDDDLENDYFEEKDVFATKEEAQEMLKELGERE